MLPYKNILCPTDFSTSSNRALRAGIQLAEHFSARLNVLHSVPPPPVVLPGPGGRVTFNVTQYMRQIEEQARKALDHLAKEYLPEKLATIVTLQSGTPARVIVQFARENEVDLIVIAARGVTEWSRSALGSVAWKVVRMAHCPVQIYRDLQPKAHG